MKFEKLGRIYHIEGAHTQCPVVETIDDVWRVYYASRDEQGRSNIYFFDLDPKTFKVGYDPREPVFELGKMGMFDCDGLMPGCIVGDIFYVLGWNRSVSVPYHQAISYAVRDDDKWRKHKGPLLDRSVYDPYAVTTPFVLGDDMWYASTTDWVEIDGKLECEYCIKHISNTEEPTVCIKYDEFTCVSCSPYVWIEDGKYKMIYSHRGNKNFRTDKTYSYRLGYAESDTPGGEWVRKDSEVGIDRSESGWDSDMISYATMHEGFLFYNGNGFGQSGIGVAKRTS